MRPSEHREHVVAASEGLPATTWLEAAERILDQQAARWRNDLNGGSVDRSEARRHLVAIGHLRTVLQSDKKLSKQKTVYEPSTNEFVRRMRRADLLCPRGWREGIRQLLVDTANSSEKEFLDNGSDQHCVDAIEIRAFVAELDFVYARGESARAQYARLKVA